ncbi:hypothetical protein TNCT_293351 [Trichonephila clavata]|uniref:Uncharacterized protein n=1 Tax=Trichonephila clavata TaxID=2740835 RepID=A0A8X6KR16_TRICU|nr:hypothetical protein TNCT_293351 [Trichonephila clavata]
MSFENRFPGIIGRSVNKLKRLSQGRIYPSIVEHVSRFISLGNGKPSRASKALFPGQALEGTCTKKGYYSESVVADSWHRMHYDRHVCFFQSSH